MFDGLRYEKLYSKAIVALLLLVSVAGFVHGVRASVAQMIHKSVRYDNEEASRKDPIAASDAAEIAHRLYPYNYYFCIWIAENCWYYRNDESGKEVAERVELAQMWCKRGLMLNQWKSQLRLLQARLMARKAPSDAADYWNKYVDWHFWDVYNHVALLEFYVLSGNLEAAAGELRWVEGSSYHKYANDLFRLAWRREMMGTPEM